MFQCLLHNVLAKAHARPDELHVHGSVHCKYKYNLIERTKKMLLCSGIYYSSVSILLNMFRATQRPPSGAQKL